MVGIPSSPSTLNPTMKRDKVKEMVDENKKEEAAKAAETKDDRPLCPFCAQHYDVDKAPAVKTTQPIPAAKAKQLSKKQVVVDDYIATVQDLGDKKRDLVNRIAKAHGLEYMMNLGVENDPRETERLGELFLFAPEDTTGKTKVYLKFKATKDELAELKALSWELETAISKMQKANLALNKCLMGVANELEWIHRPIVQDGKGNLIAQSWVEQQIKDTAERVRKELQEKAKK